MRRGRSQFIKFGICAIIVLAIFYFLFSEPNGSSKVNQAFSAPFRADKQRERPVYVKGMLRLIK